MPATICTHLNLLPRECNFFLSALAESLLFRTLAGTGVADVGRGTSRLGDHCLDQVLNYTRALCRTASNRPQAPRRTKTRRLSTTCTLAKVDLPRPLCRIRQCGQREESPGIRSRQVVQAECSVLIAKLPHSCFRPGLPNSVIHPVEEDFDGFNPIFRGAVARGKRLSSSIATGRHRPAGRPACGHAPRRQWCSIARGRIPLLQ